METLSQNFSKRAIVISSAPDNVSSPEIRTQHISEFHSDADSDKVAHSSELPLTYFNPELEIISASDSSNYGISRILHGGQRKATACAARSFIAAEKDYIKLGKQALAIIFVVKYFQKMLHGTHFMPVKEHKPLLPLFKVKKRIPFFTYNRLKRLVTMLDNCVIAVVKFKSEVHQILIESIRRLPVTAETVCANTTDVEILLKPNDETCSKLPRRKVLARNFVYWPQVDAEINKFCQKCRLCQNAAKATPKCLEQPWPASDEPCESIHWDYAGLINGRSSLT
ncbi:hypothetical protein X801_04248 [Opisthorchis viverrini]|uniref:Reverse transcriptase RNase H-like domain-containing protein n=1 Tax=Opisthorchis viverrini TaxID=6198 RepID=A0A1S8WZM9_OPIVI|nr:hypothetical protein X801_04248 [Opisthorchis viverrini]